MGFESFIAFKHLKHRHKTGFISLTTVISILCVTIGVMALIVVLAVMSGFDRELKSKIVSVQPHLRIEKTDGVDNYLKHIVELQQQAIPGLKTIAPYVEGQAIIRSATNAVGVLVKGMDPAREDLEIYQRHMVSGRFDLSDTVETTQKRRFLLFKKTIQKNYGGILLGEALAARLGVGAGDAVDLISPTQEREMSLMPQRAQSRSFVVKGVFRVGMNDFDTLLVLVDLPQAQSLYQLGGRVTGIGLRFENVDDAQRWKFFLRGQFTPDYFFRTWYDMNHNFFQALKVEKSVMTIILGLIILVAALNIVASLIMIVMEKTKDIGILRALGATRSSIRKIFMREGFFVGFLGIVFGTSSGLALLWYRNQILDFIKKTTGWELFPSDVYLFDKLPAEIHAPDVIGIVSFALLASVLAALYPAQRAASLDPVEALRYE